MTTKHTPGPWETSKDAVPEGYVQVTVYDAFGGRVATVFKAEANADLISAAPELLKLAYAVRSDYRSGTKHDLVGMAKAAIEKAEGNQ